MLRWQAESAMKRCPSRVAAELLNQYPTYLANKEKTCIDCHKGIAHRLPNMAGKM